MTDQSHHAQKIENINRRIAELLETPESERGAIFFDSAHSAVSELVKAQEARIKELEAAKRSAALDAMAARDNADIAGELWNYDIQAAPEDQELLLTIAVGDRKVVSNCVFLDGEWLDTQGWEAIDDTIAEIVAWRPLPTPAPAKEGV